MSEGELVTQDGEKEIPKTVVARRSEKVMEQWRFIEFKGRCMVRVHEPYPHYMPLRKSKFDRMAYETWGGLTRGQVSDMYAFVQSCAPDYNENAHLIKFGLTLQDAMLHPELNDYDIEFSNRNKQRVWDTQNLTWTLPDVTEEPVWTSPYPRVKEQLDKDAAPLPFIMSLAGGDQGLYDDIMQSIAPMVMDKKPDGVIWWVGDGANGKSTLMDALYRVFPDQLTSLTVKTLQDGRDAAALNGALANIVKESSEGRVDDTESYKALGTHESYRVHKFHSQETELVNTNLHTIFSANQIPAFNDKGHSAKRRTFIVPFTQRFQSDPDFERKTFTAEFFGRLISEMTKYAIRIKKQGYRYKWSAVTAGAKEEYDKEASNAEEYAKQVIDQGLVAFNSFNPLRMDYENWCMENGYVPLGVGNLRKAVRTAGFEEVSQREGKNVGKIWRLNTVGPEAPLEPFNLGRPGLFSTTGFMPYGPDPEPIEKDTGQSTILNGKW